MQTLINVVDSPDCLLSAARQAIELISQGIQCESIYFGMDFLILLVKALLSNIAFYVGFSRFKISQ